MLQGFKGDAIIDEGATTEEPKVGLCGTIKENFPGRKNDV
jgi:hypothetical protein